ncbi:MAG TPA: DUF1653 domain-containing protein, partial [Gammaproteobacteria bacterium]|nr:DUF1653 domain-containing protein [Gammaproteobacteria bacterium]
YNGNLYHAIAVCRHSETLEEMVIYRALYADYGLWVRPKAMFNETVHINGVVVQRFTFAKTIDVEAPVLHEASANL